jgi:hypothetical protein
MTEVGGFAGRVIEVFATWSPASAPRSGSSTNAETKDDCFTLPRYGEIDEVSIWKKGRFSGDSPPLPSATESLEWWIFLNFRLVLF